MLKLNIISTGIALPAELISSAMLDVKLNKPAGYTYQKSGVLSRRFCTANQSQSALAAEALLNALENASLKPHGIDLLIAACGVQEQALPSTACAIAAHAGLKEGTPAFDVNASCLSFVNALNIAATLLATGAYERIAVVSADQPSRGLDWNEPEASLIFGDGAAAAILEKGSARQGIRAFGFNTFTEGRTFCEIRAGGTRANPSNGATPQDYLFIMDGKRTLKLALQKMPTFLETLLQKAAAPIESIDCVVPHQASHLGMAHMIKRLGIDAAKVINIYPTHGNQVAASMPTALHEAFMTHKLGKSKRTLLLGTSAGLSLGGMVLDL